MMDRESVRLKIFLIVFIVALYFIFFSIFLIATAKASEKLRVAYISDSPGSSAPYWIAKDAGIQKIWAGFGTDFHQRKHTGHSELMAGDLDCRHLCDQRQIGRG
jgi:hypothetical protein